ncbi:MAG: branched-chain-amino-acid transaminase [Candidatus Altiarchaeota archaeon]|nr:branched-chain-amino-acid transaminase [Candidatus Altiarchaeota archaeon]
MTSEPLVYIDGKFYPKGDAKISVFDHGLLYGDGVFEGIRCYNGVVFRLKQHIDRLYSSAQYINLRIPVSKEEMGKIVCDTIRKNGQKDAYVRLVVTRGFGDLGLDPRKCPKPTTICISQQFDPLYGDMYDKGISIVSVGARRIAPDSFDVKAKTLNYLNNILAKIQANLAGCDEALMMNNLGYACEGTGDNFFIVKDGKIYTPPTEAGVLRGITRQVVFEIADKLRTRYTEKNLTLFDVYTADEAFMTGTAAEIIPIICVDDRTIGDGKPGAITKRLMAEFVKIREKDGTKV